jgi:hypothetical protein
MSDAPGNSTLNSLPSGKWRPLRYNAPDCPVYAPDSVRCATGATATSRATVDCNALNARLRAQRSEHAQQAHRTVYRTCPVHHWTAQRPHKSELQRSDPNGWLTWLAHRTVRCAMRQQTSNGHILVVGAINTPTTPHSIASKFSIFQLLTRAIAFNSRHNQRDQIFSQVQNHSKSNSD